MSRLSRKCEIFNISHPYRPPRSVTGIAFLLLLTLPSVFDWLFRSHFCTVFVTSAVELLNELKIRLPGVLLNAPGVGTRLYADTVT
jgi:hypothetical protein